ncbi:uncharacterized protein LOC142348667 [Convolutriloba macropyga]|uniref:uncharacterized protein LOC142348667 n=1 Tax=Convolutriloba macropyga TaxID=536237 RepID=UPI003F5244CC
MTNFLGALNFTQMLFSYYLSEQGDKANSNFVISPVSAFIPMCMVNNGAKGTTRDEIHKGLQLTEQNNFCEEAENLVKLFDTSDFEEFELSVANGLFINKKFETKANFRKSLQDSYNADAEKVDFGSNEGEKIVNKWVEEQTNGKIKEILKGTSRNTALVAINAIYLKGFWHHPFGINLTKTEKFYTKSGEMDARFMLCTNSFRYFKSKTDDGKSFEVVFMQYRDGSKSVDWQMALILPEKRGNPVDLKQLISLKLFDLYDRSNFRYIQLKVPKSKIQTEVNAVPLLKKLGIKAAFGKGANFSDMTEGSVYINQVKQKAVIEIDEEATEARAITYVGITLFSPRGKTVRQELPIVKFESPFLFAIINPKAKFIAFAGIVSKPKF